MLPRSFTRPWNFQAPLFIPEPIHRDRYILARIDDFGHYIEVETIYFCEFPHKFPSRFLLKNFYWPNPLLKFSTRVNFVGLIETPPDDEVRSKEVQFEGWIIGFHDFNDTFVEFTVIACCSDELRVVFLIVPWKAVEPDSCPPIALAASRMVFWNYLHSEDIMLYARSLLNRSGRYFGWGPTGAEVANLLIDLRCAPVDVSTSRDPTSLSLVCVLSGGHSNNLF